MVRHPITYLLYDLRDLQWNWTCQYSIDAEPEEDKENEPLIDSDDESDDDENSPDSDD